MAAVTSKVAISAHRGGTEQYPEASWEAYRNAYRTGAEYVEFDVRRLADGQLVCYHDPCAAGDPAAPLRTLSYGELCRLAGYEVPTVAGVMAAIAGKATGHVDLKETGYEEEVIQLAVRTLGEQEFVVTSLEDRSLARIAQAFPRVRTALTLGRSRAEIRRLALASTRFHELYPVRRVRACGARWVAVDKTLARYGVLRACARHGIGVMVWTVDEPALIDRFLTDPRVDVLVTNRPVYAIGRRTRLRGQPAG
jgi:glycerophosphoryl diester phosphodiesterase